MAEKGRISVDSVLESLGTFGRYQLWQTFLISLLNLSTAFHLLNFIFIAQPVLHKCDKSEVGNSSGYEYESCQILTYNTSTNTSSSLQCQTWNYPVQKQHSIVSEWDLVCSDTFLARLPQSLFVIGQGVGAVIFSNLADRWGRKPFVIVSHVLTGCVGVVLAFAPDIATFSVLRFLNGVCQQGMVLVSGTLLLETYPRRRRVEALAYNGLVWSVCTVSITLLAYLLRHVSWRYLQLAFASVSVTAVIHIIFLEESLRWLITNRMYDKASALLSKAAQMNHVKMTSFEVQGLEIKDASTTEGDQCTPMLSVVERSDDEKEDMKYSCTDIFRSKFMLRMSTVVWCTWLIDSLTYFSLYLTSSSLADDFYINFLLNSLAEVPSAPLFLFFGKRLGRRKFFIIFHMIAAVCLLTATGIKGLTVGGAGSTLATVFAFVGKVANTACFNGLFTYTPEIYPTNMRTIGFGAGSTAGRVGGCIAPFISILCGLWGIKLHLIRNRRDRSEELSRNQEIYIR